MPYHPVITANTEINGMPPIIRPRRSVLYMPGANARALDKARSLPADCVIFDLEDAVAPDAKARAREQIVAAVRQGGYGKREVVIRVNALHSPWGQDDVAAVAAIGADALLFPKIESVEQVHDAVTAIEAGGASDALPIWIMTETPRGVLAIQDIVAAHPRLATVVMGTSDLVKELRGRHTPDRAGLLPSLARCVLAARAQGLDIIDGVHLDLDDEAGLRRACEQGRDLGFDGKSLIHPKQIAVANEIFSPDAHEVEHAYAIIAAWEQARRDGKGIAVVDGKLVENLHIDEAQRTLAMARAVDDQTAR